MNEDHHTYEKEACHDEPANKQIVDESSRKRDGRQCKQPSESILEQWRSLAIDKRIESTVAIIGLIVGIFVALVALNQLDAMREQSDAMRLQLAEMKSGSADTKTIAESAKAQTEALILDQRPWVGIKSMRMETFEVNKPVQVVILLTNSGKTFARQVVVVGHKAIGRKDVVPDFDQMSKILPKKPARPKVIFPNLMVSVMQNTSFLLSESQFAEIRNRTQIFYIFGYITYTDAFDKEHMTEFCGLYDPNNPELYLCDQHQNAT
jgi:hypothetical protein